MNLTDKNQDYNIIVIASAITILTGFVGVLAYFQSKKHHKINQEVLNLEKEIKILELAQKTKEAKKNGILA